MLPDLKRSLLCVGASFSILTQAAPSAYESCKCAPTDPCWPSASEWVAFNKTVSGRLIKTVPVAAPCYKGPYYNAAACADIEARWSDSVFQSQFPIGYSYPITQSCDIPGGNTTTCTVGQDPPYAINASSTAHVVAGIHYAADKNLRLAIKMTGHDLIGRSTGYGSLEIWIAHLRNGITFEKTYQPSTSCKANHWTGAAINVGGGYNWSAVYKVAQTNNVIVVGGGCPDVGVLGGYTQGGGHSLAMHQFGPAADQLLEARVILANGQQVVASPCQHSDLFTALRGGGGGTYGIIISGKIKAYPETSIIGQSLTLAPKSLDHLADFMAAVRIIYEALPSLQDGGLSGYGSWTAYSPTPFIGNSTAGLTYSMGAFGKTKSQVQSLFAPTQAKLAQCNHTTDLFVNYTAYESYFDYYFATNGINSAAESSSALVSRLLTKESLSNSSGLARMLNITAGQPEEFTFNEIGAVGGGAVLSTPDPYSGINPAWRQTYVMNIVARGYLDTTNYTTAQAIHHDITYVKGRAMTALAPNTGSYMNEGDYQDPNYLKNYYGNALPQLRAAKAKYDPNGTFYCPTCVGSDQWEQQPSGKLCRL
ncbi:hypothetical protein H2200_003782 [Cladophialophora chaetospira]|uniref:FAD-binding PCMH-type domain-containing protein n=1 Tax=Cladophialophora chaetospira TaxID=386627 RepID=A0AA39CL18_9EURO|nr:hypothetical protein H2200_003782 [Cladophialophora chaetospira]